MGTWVLLVMILSPEGDVYTHTFSDPQTTEKDCMQAGANWIQTQRPESAPQFICVLKAPKKDKET
jgi:hypothetical protein